MVRPSLRPVMKDKFGYGERMGVVESLWTFNLNLWRFWGGSWKHIWQYLCGRWTVLHAKGGRMAKSLVWASSMVPLIEVAEVKRGWEEPTFYRMQDRCQFGGIGISMRRFRLKYLCIIGQDVVEKSIIDLIYCAIMQECCERERKIRKGVTWEDQHSHLGNKWITEKALYTEIRHISHTKISLTIHVS